MINQDIWPDHIGPQRHDGHPSLKASSPNSTTEWDVVPNNDELPGDDVVPNNDALPDNTPTKGNTRPAQSAPSGPRDP
jgi:hypothetical protein